jgi:hypothetical protein
MLKAGGAQSVHEMITRATNIEEKTNGVPQPRRKGGRHGIVIIKQNKQLILNRGWCN